MQVQKIETTSSVKYIQKRDGRKQNFDVLKIAQALFQAAQQLEQHYSLEDVRKIAKKVEEKTGGVNKNGQT